MSSSDMSSSELHERPAEALARAADPDRLLVGGLVALGYVALTERGLVVTGDGLIRITESE